MPKDLLEKLVGQTVLVDEGLNFATYGLLRDLNLQHLEISPAIRIGVGDGRGKISGFESLVKYAGPIYHGALVLGEELGRYFVNRNQARRIVPYDINKALSEHLSENQRKRIETIFGIKK